MGTVSIGRSLLIRQVLLTILVVVLGGFAYSGAHDVEILARALVNGDAQASPDTARAILAAAERVSSHILITTGAAAFIMSVISLPVMYLTIVRPVKALADAVDRIAAGDLGASIEGEDRKDELGVMARGVHRIQMDAAARADRAERVAGAAAESANELRGRVIAERVNAFSVDLVATVTQLSSMTKRLSEAADIMIAAARNASEGSDQATGASSHAARDVSSVATASEELLDSIEEISRQVVQSTNVVKVAVERAVDTNAGMGRLSEAAQKVGDVVSLISRIAAQTNLLALNATIEAARAGEAGRGFAVVAQEVKTLATQTAKATQDITGQIAEMQEATDLSVDAIDKIQRKISEVEHISTIIAAAVHEQGAATQEIARNVRSAAAGTASMSGHIENVVRSVGETSTSAASVSSLARELDDIVVSMTNMVDSFTRNLKVA
jgi:methyl-accepting chemotaxis protein